MSAVHRWGTLELVALEAAPRLCRRVVYQVNAIDP